VHQWSTNFQEKSIMSQETVATILMFCAAVATLASSTLPVSDGAKAGLTFTVLVINAALSAFFGAVTVKARQQRIEADRLAAQQGAKPAPVVGCGAAGRAAPAAPQAVKRPDDAR
jgi:hypothetical protein